MSLVVHEIIILQNKPYIYQDNAYLCQVFSLKNGYHSALICPDREFIDKFILYQVVYSHKSNHLNKIYNITEICNFQIKKNYLLPYLQLNQLLYRLLYITKTNNTSELFKRYMVCLHGNSLPSIIQYQGWIMDDLCLDRQIIDRSTDLTKLDDNVLEQISNELHNTLTLYLSNF